ncbi:hypothetical protein ACJMK2_038226, partial [Sinanodonta woodiana]
QMMDLKKEVRNFIYPSKSEITEANILLLGSVGAGKSSFINTIYSCFRGCYTSVAGSGLTDRSLTTK